MESPSTTIEEVEQNNNDNNTLQQFIQLLENEGIVTVEAEQIATCIVIDRFNHNIELLFDMVIDMDIDSFRKEFNNEIKGKLTQNLTLQAIKKWIVVLTTPLIIATTTTSSSLPTTTTINTAGKKVAPILRSHKVPTKSSDGFILNGHLLSVNSIAFINEETDCKIITTSWDNTMRLWDIKTGKCIFQQQIGDNENRVHCVVSTRNNQHLLTGHTDGNIRVWDCTVEKSTAFAPIKTIKVYKFSVRKLIMWGSEFPDHVVCGMNDGSICIVDYIKGKLLHKKIYRSTTTSNTSTNLVDRIFDENRTSYEIASLHVHTTQRWLVMANSNSLITIMDHFLRIKGTFYAKHGPSPKALGNGNILTHPDKQIICGAVFAGNRIITGGCWDSSLRVWEVGSLLLTSDTNKSNDIPNPWTISTGYRVNCITLSMDGKFLAVGMHGGILSIYSLPDLMCLTTIKDVHPLKIDGVWFSRNGSRFVTVGGRPVNYTQIVETRRETRNRWLRDNNLYWAYYNNPPAYAGVIDRMNFDDPNMDDLHFDNEEDLLFDERRSMVRVRAFGMVVGN
jgi:WD40 repeat protein